MLLHDNWTFGQPGDPSFRTAVVPGHVHTDLMRSGLIPDPFFGDNEKAVQWVGEKSWEYRTSFLVPKAIMKKEVVELCFEGLDTYADVYLNGSRILVSDNMFRTYKVNVKSLLSDGNNSLKIIFSPAAAVCSTRAATHSYALPDERGFLRKAPYHFGWDWGPRLVTCGIWKPVSLQGTDKVSILSSCIYTEKIDKDGKSAEMRALVELVSQDDEQVELTLQVQGREVFSKKIKVQPGENRIGYSFQMEDPSLWQCDDPHLYRYTVGLTVDKRISDRREGRFGVRTIELVTEKDKEGNTFYFRLNGEPLFMKGANLIPLDNFPSRVTEAKYRKLISMAREANMNMLRVWGGGIYEADLFYDLCDEYGILVWQDFMFACNLYPGSGEFLENVRREAIDQVRRLREHPSLALWCGNNEIDEGWHNWGWQEQLGYSEKEIVEAREDYRKLFEELLPAVVRDYDGSRDYWPSSPKHGWGREESLHEGDMHYWGVWWGEEPFDEYEKKVGRFMSEYGFQAFPDKGTLEEYLLPEDRQVDSEALQNHQKHPRGMELIRLYMERDYRVPDAFEDHVYVSQLLQAEGMKTAIEAHRRDMPRCMGTLFWQFNDCWPVISWSAVDYRGNRKAVYYFARKAFEDLMLSLELTGDSLLVHAVSDLRDTLEGVVDLRVMSFTGKTLYHDSSTVRIPAGRASIIHRIGSGGMLNGLDPARCLILAELRTEDGQVFEAVRYFVKPKDLELPGAELHSESVRIDEGRLFILRSDRLIKNIFLEIKGDEGSFEDNFFDLLPGREARVIYRTDNKDLPALSWRSLR